MHNASTNNLTKNRNANLNLGNKRASSVLRLKPLAKKKVDLNSSDLDIGGVMIFD